MKKGKPNLVKSNLLKPRLNELLSSKKEIPTITAKTRSTPMSEETKKKIGAGNYEAHRRRKKSLDENLKSYLSWDDILPSLSGS